MKVRSRIVASRFSGVLYPCREHYSRNKILYCFVFFFIFCALLTGIFTAAKNSTSILFFSIEGWGITEFLEGELGSGEMFFSRFLSCGVCLVIILACSLSVFLSPIGVFALIYRSYLIGLGTTFLICNCGFGGALTGIFLIFPSQIINVFLLSVFYVMSFSRAKRKRLYGKGCEKISIFWLFLLFLVLICLICGIETLILSIFSSKIILVI